MVFLDLLLRAPFCRRWLHKEDYAFDDKVEENMQDEFLSFRQELSPQLYFMIGFKDRALEDEYIEDLARTNKKRAMLGYAISFFIFFAGLFLDTMQQEPLNNAINNFSEEQLEALQEYDYNGNMETKLNGPIAAVMAFMLAGGIAVPILYMSKRLERKRNAMTIIGFVFLLYIAVMGYYFQWNWNTSNYVYGPGSWPLMLSLYITVPLLPLAFMHLPGYFVMELMFWSSFVFLLLLPLLENMFSVFITANWQLAIQHMAPGESETWQLICTGELLQSCVLDWKFKVVYPYALIWILSFAIVITTSMSCRENRRAFINKKVMEVQKEKLIIAHKTREENLVKEHKKKEDTIIEMFQTF